MIRSLDGERTRVQASGTRGEKGGVDVADSIHSCDHNIYIYSNERWFAWKKQEANCAGAVSTSATQCLDLGLGLLEHGFCDKASLNLASSRLWHDVGKEDLLIVRHATRR